MRETKFQNPHTQASQIGSVSFDRPSLFGFHVGKSAVSPSPKTALEIKARRYASDIPTLTMLSDGNP